MIQRPRLLPILIAAAALLLCAKIANIWFALDANPVTEARAQATPAEQKPAHAAQPAPAGQPAPKAEAATAGPRPARDASQFSPQEVQVLQSLAQRRDALDKRASEIDQREALLQAAEQRLNDKIAKLAAMQQTIDETFKKQDQKDETQLKSLVKIYETMKPKEAARIFEQLDLPVLLEVMERMKEQKTAPILADMDPGRAKAVTLALAARRPAPEAKP
jgi:flagellar motility protein MotE (MotC chaperone)